ncbi:heme-binding-like protein [Hibiscus syriacus]|uniref:Heme-binding-like protein n=1 Tax=Hibiscus syriacus TaxID=106335 RepID=A0A6A3CDL6_HIBSY|nr:probable L-type lectin-domain containing receptor kinase S.7 [Hibiscus syriacus]KAE8727290.1 heme-binding-like protein [Hibiscus syriacus]
MATISISKYFTVLIFFHFKVLALEQISSFSFNNFGKDPNFESTIALYGDAHVANGGSVIELTNSVKWSAGRAMYKKPIKLFEGKARNFASFSNYFSFSMSHENGNGLAFVMVHRTFDVNVLNNSSFGVSFNGSHVGIDVGSLVSVKVRNLSSVNVVLNHGEKLHFWIDYEATSNRLEIRLSQSSTRPNGPLFSHSIDLSKLWNDEEVFVGLSSSNGNSKQTSFIHSWSFKLRQVPNWMHSQPLDPEAISNNSKLLTTSHKRSSCFWEVVAMFIFGCVCGMSTASCLVYLRTVLGGRRPVVPEECSVHPVDFEYKKVELVVEKVVKDDKK